jgi:phage minor structural protein
MITVYDSKETNFNNNGVCILDPIVKNCKVTESLNSEYILDIEVTKDKSEKYKYITEFCIIKVDGQLFRLYNQSNLQDKGITIRATLHHISYDIDTDFLENITVINTTVDNALRSVILDNRFTVLNTDISTTRTMNFTKDKPVNAIFKILLPAYGGELKRDNFNIGIVSKIGKETGLSIEYAKNITGFEQTLDYSEIVTKMMPTGKDGCTIDLINGGSKWIESPRLSDYFKTFSSEVTFDNLEDATELKSAGESLWGTIDLPKVNYKVNFANLERTEQYKNNPVYKQFEGLELGDCVIIKHKVFNVNLTARVIKIAKDALTGNTLEIELGEFRDNIFNAFDKFDYKIASVSSKLEEAKKDIYTKVTQTDERITLEAARLDGDISDTRSQLEITASEIRSEVTDTKNGLESEITQTANSLTSTINDTKNSLQSQITQNANNISLKVSKNNVVSEINQSSESITINANKVNLNGYVTVSSLSGSGTTTIDGSNIKTGTLSGDRIYGGEIVGAKIKGDTIDCTGVFRILPVGANFYATMARIEFYNGTTGGTGYIQRFGGSFFTSDNWNFSSVAVSGSLSCNSISCTNAPWALSGHTHSQYSLTSHNHDSNYANLYHNHSGASIYPSYMNCSGNIEGNGIYGTLLYSTGSCSVEGSLVVAGTKNCVQITENYGKRLINAYETAEYYFGDIGEDTLTNGECKVVIENIFKECVNTEVAYQVFLTKYGEGDVWISERSKDYFIVKGTKDISFGWEIKAKRKGYETNRLQEFNMKTSA